MRKPILISTVAALAIAQPGMVAMASVQPDPTAAAAHAVISQQPVDEQAVRQRGDAYAAAFLAAFRQASTDYRQAFTQGVADGRQGRVRSIAGNVAQVAYQRGLARGQRLQAADNSHTAAERSVGVVTPADGGQQSPAAGAMGPADRGLIADDATTAGPADQGEYATQAPTNVQWAFINHLATAAQRVGAEYDLYPSVIIAQAALESNWGTSRLGRAPFHNLFGVKGYFAGRTTQQPTSEYQAGRKLLVVDNFRRYQSDEAALRDYATTLQAPLYRGVHRQYAASYRQATHALQGRYATDPQYEQKLNRLIDGFKLTRYDHQPRHAAAGHATPVKVQLADDRIGQSAAPARATRPAHRDRGHHRLSTLASVLGGLGSAGLVELGRRLFLK